MLLSQKAVDLHERHAAERSGMAQRQSFSNATFSLRPLQGCVWPEVKMAFSILSVSYLPQPLLAVSACSLGSEAC